MLTEKNTQILDIEEKYRSDSSGDPTEKYEKASKPGVSISAEMRLKTSKKLKRICYICPKPGKRSKVECIHCRKFTCNLHSHDVRVCQNCITENR